MFADKEVLDTTAISLAIKIYWFSLISKRRVRRLVFAGTRGMLNVMTREIELSRLCITKQIKVTQLLGIPRFVFKKLDMNANKCIIPYLRHERLPSFSAGNAEC